VRHRGHDREQLANGRALIEQPEHGARLTTCEQPHEQLGTELRRASEHVEQHAIEQPIASSLARTGEGVTMGFERGEDRVVVGEDARERVTGARLEAAAGDPDPSHATAPPGKLLIGEWQHAGLVSAHVKAREPMLLAQHGLEGRAHGLCGLPSADLDQVDQRRARAAGDDVEEPQALGRARPQIHERGLLGIEAWMLDLEVQPAKRLPGEHPARGVTQACELEPTVEGMGGRDRLAIDDREQRIGGDDARDPTVLTRDTRALAQLGEQVVAQRRPAQRVIAMLAELERACTSGSVDAQAREAVLNQLGEGRRTGQPKPDGAIEVRLRGRAEPDPLGAGIDEQQRALRKPACQRGRERQACEPCSGDDEVEATHVPELGPRLRMHAITPRGTIRAMFDDVSPGPKLPLDDQDASAVQRLGRWMRVVGTIQLAISGMFLLFLLLGFSCGVMAGGHEEPAAMLVSVVMIALFGVVLYQGLRIQAAGEQFKNLADEREVDYLEIAFTRLKTVFVLDLIIGPLLSIWLFGGSL
jgi:hypothetical protein